MTKSNENLDKLINPLIAELLKNPVLDEVKIEIIKEELNQQSYQINSSNIAKKMLKQQQSTETEPA